MAYQDDLFGPPETRPYRQSDNTSWGNYAGRPNANPDDPNINSGAQQDVNRYRGLGEAAANRQAYQNDWNRANGANIQAQWARGDQQDALSLQRDAAYGNAPSAAQSLGRNMLDQSIQAQMAGAASARGGSLAQAAAMRGASQQAQAMQMQGTNQLTAMRAQEQAQARGDYMAGASQIRGQDYQNQALLQQQQGMNMQSELHQRDLNQQAQMGYEQMGFNTNKAQLDAAMQRYGIDASRNNADAQRDWQSNENDKAFYRDLGKGVVGGALGGIGGLLSDENAKLPIPGGMGALAMTGGLGGAPMGGGQSGGVMTGPVGVAPGPQNPMQAAGMGLGMLTAARSLSDENAKMPVGLAGYAQPGADGLLVAPVGLSAARGYRDQLHYVGSGTEGDMFVPQAAPPPVAKDGTALAPGSDDWARYGEPGKADMSAAMSGGDVTPVDWSAGGADPKKKPGALARFGGGLQAFGNQYMANSLSDERAKDVVPLMNTREGELRQELGPDGRAYYDAPASPSIVPAKFAAMQRDAEGKAGEPSTRLAKAASAKGRKEKPLDYAYLMRQADAGILAANEERDAIQSGRQTSGLAQVMAQRNAMSGAARAMQSVPYAYKPGMQPPDQTPGEVNVGPMAQNMARNPVTATAVKRDPATGLLMLDQGKMTKVLGGVVADQQQQLDEQRLALASIAAKQGRR